LADQDYRKWRESAPHGPTRPDKATPSKREGGPDEKNTRIASLHLGILAMAIGTFLSTRTLSQTSRFFSVSLPLRAPQAFLSFKYSIARSCSPLHTRLLDRAFGLYIFTLKARQTISPGRLPKYPDPVRGMSSFLSSRGHNPRKPVPAKPPSWLTIPDRGLFTGIAILGAIGSGKTSCCMLPFAEQILAYKATDKEKRIGGLILESKEIFAAK